MSAVKMHGQPSLSEMLKYRHRLLNMKGINKHPCIILLHSGHDITTKTKVIAKEERNH